MEPFSAGAAAITLCPIIISTARELSKIIKNVIYARKEIQKLTTELIIFAEVFDDFCEAIDSREQDRLMRAPIRALIQYSTKAQKDAQTLLDRVHALSTDPKYQPSATEVVSAYFKWHFSVSAINCIRLMLSVARESINGLTNILNIKQMDQELQMLRSILTHDQKERIEKKLGMTVEQRRKMLEQKMRDRRVRRHDIEKRIRVAQEKAIGYQKESKGSRFQPQTNKMFKLSEAVTNYAEQLLPLNQSGRRSRVLQPIDVTVVPESVATGSSTPSTRISSRSSIQGENTSISSATPITIPSSTSPPNPGDVSNVEVPSSKPEPKSDILNYGDICRGTCKRTQEHQTSLPSIVPDRTASNSSDESEKTPRFVKPGPPKIAVYAEYVEKYVTKDRAKPEIVRPASSKAKQKIKESDRFSIAGGAGTAESSNNRHVPERPETPPEEDLGLQEGEDEDDSFDAQSESDAPSVEGQTPFRPLFGIKGNAPRGWRTRHKKDESS